MEETRNIHIKLNLTTDVIVFFFLTFQAGSLENLEYWGPGGEEAQSHGQLHETSPDDSTAYRSGQCGQLLFLRGPPYLWSDISIRTYIS